jgi:hypothetical protein
MAVIEEIIEDEYVDNSSQTETSSSSPPQDTATKKINDLDITAPLEKLELSEDEVRMTLLFPVSMAEAAAGALYQNLPPTINQFETNYRDHSDNNCSFCRSCLKKHRGTRRQEIRRSAKATTPRHSNTISWL